MKVCPSCGTPQKNENNVCVECGAKLGNPLSPDEEQAERNRQQKGMQSRAVYRGWFEYDYLDPFALGWKHKAAAALNILLGIAAIVSMVGADYLPVGKPVICLYVTVFCIINTVELIFPEIGWELTKFKGEVRGLNVDDEPTDRYIFMHRLWVLIFTVIAVILMIYAYIPDAPRAVNTANIFGETFITTFQ